MAFDGSGGNRRHLEAIQIGTDLRPRRLNQQPGESEDRFGRPMVSSMAFLSRGVTTTAKFYLLDLASGNGKRTSPEPRKRRQPNTCSSDGHHIAFLFLSGVMKTRAYLFPEVAALR